MQNKYSCGNDPQPGDVVVREKLSQLISRTDMGGNQKLDWLISFISELQQPQPDMAKLIEEKDEAIRELVAGLEQINHTCGTVNFSSHTQMKEAIEHSVSISDELLTKYKQP